MYTNNKRATRSFSSSRNSRPGGSRGGYSSGKKRGASQNIHPSKFINKTPIVAPEDKVAYESQHSFADFSFPELVAKNLESAGFTAPSAIQDKTIPLGLEGRDVIGLANTGTGKTAAFLLPIISQMASNPENDIALIMAPTRELAQQIDVEFKKFARGMHLYSVVCVGGMPMRPQEIGLSRDPHVIIGTPGRLRDHMNQGRIKLENVKYFVLDEADRMLDMGFVNEIRAIASELPTDRQTLCFSATMNEGVKGIMNDFMKNAELVSVKVNETSDHIWQDVVHFQDPAQRQDLLLNLLAGEEFERVIVFGETKYGVQRLSDNLERAGISSVAIHGNKSQSQRNRALRDFREQKVKVMVATDVAARGLDIPAVSHVINYDIPQTFDDYTHRIGRTGRGGKGGTALTFVPLRSMGGR